MFSCVNKLLFLSLNAKTMVVPCGSFVSKERPCEQFRGATDFDGDGQLDLMGVYKSGKRHEIMVCLQTAAGYVQLEQEKNPFYPWRLHGACRREAKFNFLDWDSDGDVDQICLDFDNLLQLVEQLPNGSVVRHPLPVPQAEDYVAADFDGDGDIDLLLVVSGSRGWKDGKWFVGEHFSAPALGRLC